MEIITGFYNLIGSLICHQLPSRTLFFDGLPLPLCARDTGIYLGVFTGVVFIAMMKRLGSDKPPGVALSVFFCLLMFPMVIDGIGSYTGLIKTDNEIRLITGAFFGLPIPFFLIPAAQFKVEAANHKIVLKSRTELATVIAINALLCVIVLKSRMLPYFLISSIIIASFLFLTGRIAYTVISRLKPGYRRYRYIGAIGITICILSVMYVMSAYMFQPLKAMLLKE